MIHRLLGTFLSPWQVFNSRVCWKEPKGLTPLWYGRGTLDCGQKLIERSKIWRMTGLSKDFFPSGLATTKLRRVHDSPNLAWQNEGERCRRVSRLSFSIWHSRLPYSDWQ